MAVHAPPNAQTAPEETLWSESERLNQSRMQQVLVLGGSLLLVAGLTAWALLTYRHPVAPYAGRAIFLLPLLILLVDLGARWSAYRVLFRGGPVLDLQTRTLLNGRALALPQVTLPLYLACAVLLGVQTATLAALVIETLLQFVAVMFRARPLTEAIYRIAANGLVVLAGGGCYQVIVKLAGARLGTASFELRLGAAAGGALVMLLLCPLIVLPLSAKSGSRPFLRSWGRYFKTPEARFQVLLLSIGPLLPLADGLDDLDAELAWILFLAPLFAIYYLAIVSLRFQRQTEELRASLH